MSRLTRAQARLVSLEARLAEVDAAYAAVLNAASSSDGENSYSNQSFEAVAKERRALEAEIEQLHETIDGLQGTEGGSSVASFQTAEATS